MYASTYMYQHVSTIMAYLSIMVPLGPLLSRWVVKVEDHKPFPNRVTLTVSSSVSPSQILLHFQTISGSSPFFVTSSGVVQVRQSRKEFD